MRRKRWWQKLRTLINQLPSRPRRLADVDRDRLVSILGGRRPRERSSESAVVIDSSSARLWDDFVRAHPRGRLYHQWAWKTVLEGAFSHIHGFVLALYDRDSGGITAGLPLYSVQSRLTGDRLVSIPFASICDPLVSRPHQEKLLADQALEFASLTGAANVRIRTSGNTCLGEDSRFAAVGGYRHHFLRLDRDKARLLKSFSRKSVRQTIGKTLRGNLRVSRAWKREHLREFYQLYSRTRQRLSLPVHPWALFRGLWEAFHAPGEMVLYRACLRGRLVGGLVTLRHPDRVSAEYLAYDSEARASHPNHGLLWEAICEAYQSGGEIFDFGRTAESDRGLLDFKRRWGTEQGRPVTRVWPAESPPSSATAGRKYRLARAVLGKLPRRQYQWMSAFCYRHLG